MEKKRLLIDNMFMRKRLVNYFILPLVALMSACSTSPKEGESTPPSSGDIPVSDITFDTNSLKLDINETYNLKITISPDNATNKAYTIKSNNISAARVSDTGLITAVGNGTAVITAKTVDGDH